MIRDIIANPIAWLVSFNLVTMLSSYVIITNRDLKKKFFNLPVVIQKLYVPAIICPYLILPFMPQPEVLPRAAAITGAGAILLVMAVILWVLAFTKIGFIPSVKPASSLMTNGAYGFVRNPIYLGNILSAAGMSLLLHAMYALLFSIVVIMHFMITSLLEEKGLVEEYGDDYLDYKKRVKYRLIPFMF